MQYEVKNDDKMKQDVEVWVMIVCDQHPDKAPDPKLVAKVRRTIAKLEGVGETYLAPNTSYVGAIAKWEEDKIPSMVALIKKVEGVKEVKTRILVLLD